MHKGFRKKADKPIAFGWPLRSDAPSGFADNSMTHDHMDSENYLLSVSITDEEM